MQTSSAHDLTRIDNDDDDDDVYDIKRDDDDEDDDINDQGNNNNDYNTTSTSPAMTATAMASSMRTTGNMGSTRTRDHNNMDLLKPDMTPTQSQLQQMQSSQHRILSAIDDDI